MPLCNQADRCCDITRLRKQADFQQVVVDERTYIIFAGGNANERGAIYVCSLGPCGAMGTELYIAWRAKPETDGMLLKAFQETCRRVQEDFAIPIFSREMLRMHLLRTLRSFGFESRWQCAENCIRE